MKIRLTKTGLFFAGYGALVVLFLVGKLIGHSSISWWWILLPAAPLILWAGAPLILSARRVLMLWWYGRGWK